MGVVKKPYKHCLAYVLGDDMRILIVSMILLTAVGCSRQPPTEHHILPVSFSGVYKIEKVPGHKGGYRIDGSCYIFTIPKSCLQTRDFKQSGGLKSGFLCKFAVKLSWKRKILTVWTDFCKMPGPYVEK